MPPTIHRKNSYHSCVEKCVGCMAVGKKSFFALCNKQDNCVVDNEEKMQTPKWYLWFRIRKFQVTCQWNIYVWHTWKKEFKMYFLGKLATHKCSKWKNTKYILFKT